MNRKYSIISATILLAIVMHSFTLGPSDKKSQLTGQYVVIAWNDLGMHCANLDFSNMCILPPYNNQRVQIIQKGSPAILPLLIQGQSGINVTYEIPGNTESVSKTNFWNYSQHLFGVTLAPNVGLTGAGLAGSMLTADSLDYFYIDGIPITAYPDSAPQVPDPYQLTLIKAYSPGGGLLGTTQSVIPVAHEINCVSSGCHNSELAILNKHDNVPGYNVNNRPILCADCHADNALGTPGQPDAKPFSQVIHMKHGEFIKSGTINDCYKCHPGPNTQCWRDVMHGSTGGITKCQDCHGSVFNVGKSIEQGREPWLEQPSCGSVACHGPNYAEEPGKLFRESRGHGGLFCSACHGSPHAIFPSVNPRDNVQNNALQGFSGTLSDCSVCHGYQPSAPGPHGIMNKAIQNLVIGNGSDTCVGVNGLIIVAGNGTTLSIQQGGSATFTAGQMIRYLPGTTVYEGGYMHGFIQPAGPYCTNTMQVLSAPGVPGLRDNISEGVFHVYPNPTTGLVYIDYPDPSNTHSLFAEVFFTDGRKALEFRPTQVNKTAIDLSGLAAGVVYLRLSFEEHVKTFKVVLQ